MMFCLSAMWHLREHGAGTTVLYLKMNTHNCDTLGEDPRTEAVRQRTLTLLTSAPAAFKQAMPVLARKVDYVQVRYDREWEEMFGVVMYGKPHVTLTDAEFQALRHMDGQRTVSEIAAKLETSRVADGSQQVIRDLAERGIVDL